VHDDRTILLATSNPAKERKLRWLLDGLGYVFRTPRDHPPADEPQETGTTHREVAAQKAAFWSARAAGLAIASDGGARIPALGERWNSLFTRRAAGPDADDRARADHLLRLMHGRKGAERAVVWVEGLALARAGELLASWQVECAPGRLVETYDPRLIEGGFYMLGLIEVPRFGKVLARLGADELAQVDDCWNELRRRVRAYLGSAERR
jgi:inosine/xanthosine triphosphate pyrophosphatase family protein